MADFNNNEPIGDTDPLSYEDALSRLEEIVTQLERGELTLEASMQKFENGIALSRVCAQKLAVAESKIQKLVDGDSGDIYVEPMGPAPAAAAGEPVTR